DLVPVVDYKGITAQPGAKNTGGMGGYSPVPSYTPELRRMIYQRIIAPTLRALERRGTPYHGVLNLNLMISPEGPSLIEFNCRFGDPELQTLAPRMHHDLLPVLMRATRFNGLKPTEHIRFVQKATVCLVLATKGYPEVSKGGDEIFGLEEAAKICRIFHAGTQLLHGRYFTTGGRAVTLVACASTLAKARDRAYRAARLIYFAGVQYRLDIARGFN